MPCPHPANRASPSLRIARSFSLTSLRLKQARALYSAPGELGQVNTTLVLDGMSGDRYELTG